MRLQSADGPAHLLFGRPHMAYRCGELYCAALAAGTGAAFVSCVTTRASLFDATAVLPSKRTRYTARFSITR